MPWYPDAIRKPVERFNPGGDKAVIRVKGRGVCFHVAVSLAASLFNYFNQPGNPCSHFYVRLDGTVEQYVDTNYRAPAQLQGNPTMLGIETAGGVTNADTEPWTNAQLIGLVNLTKWLESIDGFPLKLMENSRLPTEGLGWHRLGINPWRVSGGELWSESEGKVCPGSKKIEQIRTVILPGAKGDLDMADHASLEAQLNDLKQMVQNLIDAEAARYGVYTGRYNAETRRWESEVARDQAESALWVAEAQRDADEMAKLDEILTVVRNTAALTGGVTVEQLIDILNRTGLTVNPA